MFYIKNLVIRKKRGTHDGTPVSFDDIPNFDDSDSSDEEDSEYEEKEENNVETTNSKNSFENVESIKLTELYPSIDLSSSKNLIKIHDDLKSSFESKRENLRTLKLQKTEYMNSIKSSQEKSSQVDIDTENKKKELREIQRKIARVKETNNELKDLIRVKRKKRTKFEGSGLSDVYSLESFKEYVLSMYSLKELNSIVRDDDLLISEIITFLNK